MTPEEIQDERYRCAWCREHFVIPQLARDCEQRHEAQVESAEAS